MFTFARQPFDALRSGLGRESARRDIHLFAFIPGCKQHTFQEQDPVNIQAVQIMGELHDTLQAGGYTGHDLDRFLVRVLFCLFAEDTGIFERESFHLFLVIAYRELRRLELETLKEIFGRQTEMTLDEITRLSQVDVDQFYGIEILEWPARIAEVALWLMDHQMNLKVSEAFGQLYQRLPLKKSPHIHCANALRLDWKTILPPAQCSYIPGNPPFVGKHLMTGEQRQDMEIVWAENNGTGVLDYVTAWYHRAAEYIQGTRIVAGFVSTNSISQGE